MVFRHRGIDWESWPPSIVNNISSPAPTNNPIVIFIRMCRSASGGVWHFTESRANFSQTLLSRRPGLNHPLIDGANFICRHLHHLPVIRHESVKIGFCVGQLGDDRARQPVCFRQAL
jgi:hypothetical protein